MRRRARTLRPSSTTGRTITYSEFSRDVRKFTRAPRDFSLRRGSSVAVACEDFYRLGQTLHPLQVGRFSAVRLARVPRNAAGKVQRNLLKAAAIEAAEAAGRTPA